jgi:hypothetical protein
LRKKGREIGAMPLEQVCGAKRRANLDDHRMAK